MRRLELADMNPPVAVVSKDAPAVLTDWFSQMLSLLSPVPSAFFVPRFMVDAPAAEIVVTEAIPGMRVIPDGIYPRLNVSAAPVPEGMVSLHCRNETLPLTNSEVSIIWAAFVTAAL
jgi:hypothetical protein